MFIFRTSRDRQDTGREGVGEGGRIWNFGSFPLDVTDMVSFYLSCNCEPNVFDLIQYVGEHEKLVRAVFSLA